MKVVLGLSGGVDSALAASLLIEKGYDVHGVYLSRGGDDPSPAEKAANELGISFEVVDISSELEEKVMSEFQSAYVSGHTPNPCAICNPEVKFPSLIAAAERIGAEKIATGHYARVIYDDETGLFQLKTALSPNDQSYMLCRLTQEQLSKCIFPLGSLSKDDVRSAAAARGLTSAGQPDSMEICFIPSNDYAGWLENRGVQSLPGKILDSDGNQIGTHRGTIHYTVGQRRGIGFAGGERLFVRAINPDTNSIVLSKENEMYTNSAELTDIKWVSSASPKNLYNLSFSGDVKVRHSRVSYLATLSDLRQEGDKLCGVLTFSDKIRVPAPGQFAALYIDDAIILSGEIV